MRISGKRAIDYAESEGLLLSVSGRHGVQPAEARDARPTDVHLYVEARGDGSPDGRHMIDLARELDDDDRRAARAGAVDDDDFIRRLGRRNPAARSRMLAAAARLGLRDVVEVEVNRGEP